MPHFTTVTDLDDPRLADFREIKDRQLRPEFSSGAALQGRDPEAPWGKFMAEGDVVLHKLVRSDYRTLRVLCTPARLDRARTHLDLLPADVPVYVLAQAHFERTVGYAMHRGLLAIGARQPPLCPDSLIAACAARRPLVLLEDVVNHDNIGGIFRSAAGLGAGGVLMSGRTADPLYRKALRVAVGCVLVTPWAYAPSPPGWPAALARVREAGIRLMALTPAPDAADLRALPSHIDLDRERIAVLLGTEGPGLRPETLAAADLRVRIPIRPTIDSLNVSVTAGIVLHALSAP